MYESKKAPSMIGLNGAARTGKDTLGNLLKAEMGYTQISFAEPIRSFVASLLGATAEELEAIKEQPHALLGGKTPRYAMQTLGTDWGRDTINYSLWVDACMAKAARIINGGGRVVITDIRFANEADVIREAGGMVIKLERPSAPKPDNATHASEAGISDELVDVIIINDGSTTELLAAAQEAISKFAVDSQAA